MTHPAYRHQGLAAKLINYIPDKCGNEYDFIYLFANDKVLDFYPKFVKKQVTPKSTLRKLDVNIHADFMLMKEFAAERIPVSTRLSRL